MRYLSKEEMQAVEELELAIEGSEQENERLLASLRRENRSAFADVEYLGINVDQLGYSFN